MEEHHDNDAVDHHDEYVNDVHDRAVDHNDEYVTDVHDRAVDHNHEYVDDVHDVHDVNNRAVDHNDEYVTDVHDRAVDDHVDSASYVDYNKHFGEHNDNVDPVNEYNRCCFSSNGTIDSAGNRAVGCSRGWRGWFGSVDRQWCDFDGRGIDTVRWSGWIGSCPSPSPRRLANLSPLIISE